MLALDELAGLHETLGYNLPFLADIPGIERPDDAIILAYSAPGVVFLVLFRDVLFRDRRTGALLLLGIGLFGAAAVLDALGGIAEELLESLAALALLAGFLVLAVVRVHEVGPAEFRHGDGAGA